MLDSSSDNVADPGVGGGNSARASPGRSVAGPQPENTHHDQHRSRWRRLGPSRLKDISQPDDRLIRTVVDHVPGAGVPGLSYGVDHPFTGLRPSRFRRLVRLVARRGGDTIADERPGRPCALTLPDRLLPVAVYRHEPDHAPDRPLFGRIALHGSPRDRHLALLLALAPARRRPKGQGAIVDGALVPTRDHRLAPQGTNPSPLPSPESPNLHNIALAGSRPKDRR
jgi:hypothetical protein